MEYKELTLTPGTIVVWKSYNRLEKWWAKLRKKTLDWNSCSIVEKPITFIVNSDNTNYFRIFKPNKAYNKQEMLECLIYSLSGIAKYDFGRLFIVNLIRPNTFDLTNSYPTINILENSKYYTEVDATKENN